MGPNQSRGSLARLTALAGSRRGQPERSRGGPRPSDEAKPQERPLTARDLPGPTIQHPGRPPGGRLRASALELARTPDAPRHWPRSELRPEGIGQAGLARLPQRPPNTPSPVRENRSHTPAWPRQSEIFNRHRSKAPPPKPGRLRWQCRESIPARTAPALTGVHRGANPGSFSGGPPGVRSGHPI